MEVLTLASLIALGMRLVSFLKYIRAKDLSSAGTQVAVWAAGVAVVFLAAAADVTQNIEFFKGVVLGNVNAASKVLLGMTFLSTGSVVYEFKKALDGHDTAAEPALFPPAKVVTMTGEAVTVPETTATKVAARTRKR